jgi:tetratricopeptide (TPR) repeat protein
VKRLLTFAALIALGVLRSFADSNLDAEFDAANKLYAENKFTEATAAYEKLAQSGAVSPALLFNLGNAHFKSGHLGLAIAAYRRAEPLAPRDADLRANLQFVRGQVQGPTVRPGLVERSLALLSLNEWAGLSAGALWITLGLLALRQLRPALGGALRSWTRLAAVTTVGLGAALAFATAAQVGGRVVIITAHEATVRITPNDEAPAAFTVNDGAELRVLDRKDDWFQVTDGNAQRFGWLKSAHVALP